MNPSGTVSGSYWWIIRAAVLLLFLFVLNSCNPNTPAAEPTPTTAPKDDGSILVYVYDGDTRASLDHVVVRVTNSTITDGVDNRELRLPACDIGQFLVASAPGYETGYTPCNDSNTYIFELNKLSGVDNINYGWSSAEIDCVNCHNDAGSYNEVSEWRKTAHAKVFVDPYFQNMYRGVNTSGQFSPPGFKLDHPDQAGNCAYCHAPTAILPSLEQTDLSSYSSRPAGANGEGVTCDVCHKVLRVSLDDNNFPLAENPGMRSFEFLRSSNSFIVGSFSNILISVNDANKRHASSTCNPTLSTSEFCSACHFGKFNDIPVYNSYGEWRASKYGNNPNSSSYKTCQDCHMSHMDVKDTNTPLSKRSACSETGEKYQNFDHNLLDVGPVTLSNGTETEIPRMIQQVASLNVKLTYDTGSKSIKVRVEVENKKAGHKFPTDSPLRHLLLVVTATDQFGSSLQLTKGDKIPDWGGDPNINLNGVQGYAGLPGTVYANLLVEDVTGASPTASYWNNTKYAFTTEDGTNSDTRLKPNDPQVSEYSFTVPDLGDVQINVRLVYRYAFFNLLNQKDWVRPDILVAVANCDISLSQGKKFDCPEVEP